MAGSAAALFLISLNLVTEWRAAQRWLLFSLPISGLLIGWLIPVSAANRRVGMR